MHSAPRRAALGLVILVGCSLEHPGAPGTDAPIDLQEAAVDNPLPGDTVDVPHDVDDAADADDVPVADDTPDADDAPDADDVPIADDAADAAVADDTPDATDALDASDAADASDATDTPDVPDVPDVPVPMDTPDVPTPMDVRDVPDVPDVPAPMDVRDVPDVPDVRDVPMPMDVRDVPDVPDVPAPMDVRDAPDAPDACTGTGCVYTSCAELPAGSASGVYTLRGLGGTTWQGYCQVPMDRSPAWTLVMKVDGARTTFQYDSSHWVTASRYMDGAVDLNRNEAKYVGFNATPFHELRLQTRTGSTERDVVVTVMPHPTVASSLVDVILGRVMPAPALLQGPEPWAGVFPGARLQPMCRRFGFNIAPGGGGTRARVRIGGVGDESTANCTTPDSWVGVGGYVNEILCNVGGATISAGNVWGCDGLPTNRRVESSFVWIWVR